MGFWGWIGDNTFNLIGNIGVFIGLCFTASGLHADAKARQEEAKARRDSNLLAATENHREIWDIFLANEELGRVRKAIVNLKSEPVTEREWIFVNMVIQHLNSVYQNAKDGMFVKIEGLRRDVAEFFSLPIPNHVWKKIKVMQNDEFVLFVESCLNRE